MLLDDDFTSIVRAVRLGRRIFDNLRKAMAFLLAVHVPIAGLAVLPVLLGWPLILLPVHIVFLELIIDPAFSIAFESEREERDVMRRPPRPVSEPLFDGRTVFFSLLQGAGVLLVTAVVLTRALLVGLPEDDARVLTFATLVIADLGLILANRAISGTLLSAVRAHNTALWLVIASRCCFWPPSYCFRACATCSTSACCTSTTWSRLPSGACWAGGRTADASAARASRAGCFARTVGSHPCPRTETRIDKL